MTTFTIPGPPVSKQRPRRSPQGHWYTPAKTREAEAAVAWCAKAAGVELYPRHDYRVTIEMYTSSHRRDLDNAAKLVLDSLNALGEWDDREVVDLIVHKRSVRDGADERTVVTVEDLGPRSNAQTVDAVKS